MEYSTKTKRLKKEADDAEINLYRLMIRLGKLISVRGKSLQFEDIEMQQAAFNLMVKADIHHKISQTYDELKPLLAVSRPDADCSDEKYHDLIVGTINKIVKLREKDRATIITYYIRHRLLRLRKTIHIYKKYIDSELIKYQKKKVTTSRGEKLVGLSKEASCVTVKLRTVKRHLHEVGNTENIWDLTLFNAIRTASEAEQFLEVLLFELSRFNTKTKATELATDSRYSDQRLLLEKAANVARHLWENDSKLLHHQMKKYLEEDYQDEKGLHPFIYLPRKSFLNVLKQVAKEMNRYDLIGGQKK